MEAKCIETVLLHDCTVYYRETVVVDIIVCFSYAVVLQCLAFYVYLLPNLPRLCS